MNRDCCRGGERRACEWGDHRSHRDAESGGAWGCPGEVPDAAREPERQVWGLREPGLGSEREQAWASARRPAAEPAREWEPPEQALRELGRPRWGQPGRVPPVRALQRVPVPVPAQAWAPARAPAASRRLSRATGGLPGLQWLTMPTGRIRPCR
jgi:hypothetical protein